MPITFQTDFAQLVIGADGRSLHLIDKATGKDYCSQDALTAFASALKAGREYPATAASRAGSKITFQFAGAGASAVLKVSARKRYITFEVISVEGEGIEQLTFLDVPLTLMGSPDEPFACCALALDLKTNVTELPGASSRLRAACYPRFGFAGARAAVIACPQGRLRDVMKEVVSAAPDLPHSAIGGPWALDAETNRGSYLFNFGNVTEQTVDGWIELVKSLGFNQLDFHGGGSFRFGDCEPNRDMYPRGFASLKAVIDRLHAAGIKAGLHTYAFFIDKRCPWVTPVPDPRLAKDATFTLASLLDDKSTEVPVVESTEKMSTTTGFFVWNSITIQIDDELITYAGISKEPPYAFTNCQRGACGTRPAPHAKGARVHHLKECFGLFLPDGDATLFEEVAAKTAAAFNECGFDMMYLDALDGEGILGGGENSWHYGSRFVFEIWKRLERPALMEMSTFHHHLWYVRSRMGAWDVPARGRKRFIDIHVAGNEDNRRMFLPGQLGWWAINPWAGPHRETTFPDEIEYLCCKALGTDTGLSLMGVDPDNIRKIPALVRLAGIFRKYEDLRHSNTVSQSIKEKLRAPGREFTLEQAAGGKALFRPVRYDTHKVQGLEGWSNTWKVNNKFGRQPPQLRIEALMSAGPYEATGNVVVADLSNPAAFSHRSAQSGVTADLTASSEQVEAGPASACLAATSNHADRKSAWAGISTAFSPALDLGQHQALGVWIRGDGLGEVINIQLRSPQHVSPAISEHYVVADFTGWRYFELIEPESERYEDYSWPYGGAYPIYHMSVDMAHVGHLGLWFNNLPAGKQVRCHLSAIKALPLVKNKIRNPAITVGGKTIAFPVEIESGAYLEFRSMSDCKLYGPDGALLADVKPQGDALVLEPGDNRATFSCDATGEARPRAYVTIITRSESTL